MALVSESVASSTLVSLVGGFFLAVTLTTSIERAVLVWLLTVVCCGLVIGSTGTIPKSVIKRASLPALTLAVTPIFFFYFLAIIAFIQDPHALDFEIPWHGKIPVRPYDPFVIGGVVALGVVCFMGSLLFVSLSIVANRRILSGAQRLYKLGPKGIKRVKLIILGVGGVLTAMLSLLSVFAN